MALKCKKAATAEIYQNPELVDAIIKARLAQNFQKGKPGNANKWTDDELELRNAVVYGYIINECRTKEDCARKLAERWGINVNTGRMYVKQAMQALVANYKDVSKEQLKETYLNRIETLLKKALDEGNTKTAIQAAEMLNKLEGLYSQDINLNLQGNITFDFKE